MKSVFKFYGPSPATFLGRLMVLGVLAFLMAGAQGATRTRSGLVALYDFGSATGPIIEDRSGVGEPVDLRIADLNAVRRTAGSLEVRDSTLIQSEKPATRITEAIRETGKFTVEAWIHPANTSLSGPARILTLSKDTGGRNFTLGQEKDLFEVRFRTTQTTGNGTPALSSASKTLTRELTHVIYTRDGAGRARLYLNGKRTAELVAPGSTSNWDKSFRLGLANEMTKDRPWQGTFHLVAIYNRDLLPSEVEENFAAGPGAEAVDETEVATRVAANLQVFYDFGSSTGPTVEDRAGVGTPLNLTIENPEAVRRTAGSLEVRRPTLIRSDTGAGRLSEAIKRSGEITIEAWVRPANTTQAGPARIVTLSKDTGPRNFTLGQAADQFDVRLRTTGTDAGGMPSLSTAAKSLTSELTHVVYTRDRTGRARVYVNGRRSAEKTVGGSTANWDGTFRLALGNEHTKDRPWLGTYHLVAIYSRALAPGEVEQNFRAGSNPAAAPAQLVKGIDSEAAKLFHGEIAPLLAKHCLECHDTATRKGKLDLSKQAAALAGSRDGVVIVPGDSTNSVLWKVVESDEMPENRPPLTDREKALLREWLDGGAVWTSETIDPAIYANDRRAAGNWLRRLTVPEYIETVLSAIGVDVGKEARELLPPDVRADGFNNTAYNLTIDLAHVEAYAKLAEIIVDRMDVRAFAKKYSAHRSINDDDMRALVSKMGKELLRGPLADHEITVFSGILTTVASAGGDYDEAVSFLVQAMLQSPRFIYRIENQRGDGTVWPAGDYELAARMSYMLWGAPPDEELRRAADAGELYDRRNVASQIERMLKDPRAVKRSVQFIDEWLDLARLEQLRPSPTRFPQWDAELAADMRKETRAFFEEIVWKQQRPLTDLLNAQLTYLTPGLARHYGLPPREPGLYDLTSVPARGGLLTHASVLTVGGDDASMVTRGLFVLHELLRGVVKDPPPCVNTAPVPSKAGLTQRGVAEGRVANVSCGGCHAKFEPLAYGLEKFDGIGAYHEQDEHGNTLRDDGDVLFPGTASSVPYRTSAELMNLLAGSARVKESLTWKVAQFALGRPLVAEDAPILDKIHESAQKNGGTYASVMTAIILSDLVQMTRTETSQ